MGIAGFLDQFIEATNSVLDKILPNIALACLSGYALFFLVSNLKKIPKSQPNTPKNGGREGVSRVVLLEILLLVEILIIIAIFWMLPLALVEETGWQAWTAVLRWPLFIGGLILAARLLGNKGQKRGFLTALFHGVLLFIGWVIDSWVGVLLFSIPAIFVFYWSIGRIAQVVLPTSSSPSAAWQKFLVLVSFAWGLQRPMFMANDEAGIAAQKRIDGAPGGSIKVPGVIWTPSHRVVGVTAGNQFKRVDGPGLVFTSKFERPFQSVDLRTHHWSNTFDVMTKDGIGFRLQVHASFKIDSRPWGENEYNQLKRQNPLLRGATTFANQKSHYRYAPARVRAAISTMGTKKNETEPPIFWDNWVAGIIEEATRNRISESNLDELWRNQIDPNGKSAQHIIAEEILVKASPILKASGIELETIRIDRLLFRPETQVKLDEITSRHLNTWSEEWERQRMGLLADAQAEAERLQQEARAYAESLLLSSIAEGLEKTQKIHPRLPRYVIAMRFLSALQDYIHRRKKDDSEAENDEKLEDAQTFLLQLQKRLASNHTEEVG